MDEISEVFARILNPETLQKLKQMAPLAFDADEVAKVTYHSNGKINFNSSEINDCPERI